MVILYSKGKVKVISVLLKPKEVEQLDEGRKLHLIVKVFCQRNPFHVI